MILAVRKEIDGPIPAESVGFESITRKGEMKNTNRCELGQTKIHPLVVTVHFEHVCESLANLSQTFNAAVEILQ